MGEYFPVRSTIKVATLIQFISHAKFRKNWIKVTTLNILYELWIRCATLIIFREIVIMVATLTYFIEI